MAEEMLNLGLVEKATDPVLRPFPYVTPSDFAAQYPTPLNPVEVIAMCEELSVWASLPEEVTALQSFTWRELNSLAFSSGSAYISFADGDCPEEYSHNGTNTTITLKNIGAKKTLTQSDIMHSAAIAASGINGINQLVGPSPASGQMPGGFNNGSFVNELVSDIKAKEIRLAMTLVLNGWDRLLVKGNTSNNSLELTGIEQSLTGANGAHVNDNTASGTFAAIGFDRFLTEGCAKPTAIFGHPQAIQEALSAYFQLGYQGSQLVNFQSGDRVVPGFNFAGFVNTGIGRLTVVSDNNFSRTSIGGGAFQSTLYALRMSHHGVPLVYKLTQIPLALKDLVPGCTAIAFEVWAKTALVIKHRCAQAAYTTQFTGRITTTCPVIG